MKLDVNPGVDTLRTLAERHDLRLEDLQQQVSGKGADDPLHIGFLFVDQHVREGYSAADAERIINRPVGGVSSETSAFAMMAAAKARATEVLHEAVPGGREVASRVNAPRLSPMFSPEARKLPGRQLNGPGQRLEYHARQAMGRLGRTFTKMLPAKDRVEGIPESDLVLGGSAAADIAQQVKEMSAEERVFFRPMLLKHLSSLPEHLITKEAWTWISRADAMLGSAIHDVSPSAIKVFEHFVERVEVAKHTYTPQFYNRAELAKELVAEASLPEESHAAALEYALNQIPVDPAPSYLNGAEETMGEIEKHIATGDAAGKDAAKALLKDADHALSYLDNRQLPEDMSEALEGLKQRYVDAWNTVNSIQS